MKKFFKNLFNMASININNEIVTGKSIVISNGKVIIDGVERKIDDKIINITITGDVDVLNADVCQKITVTGNAEEVSTMNGDITIQGSVGGNAKTQAGNIRCGNVQGDVKTMSGNVTASAIAGKVKTMSGDINV